MRRLFLGFASCLLSLVTFAQSDFKTRPATDSSTPGIVSERAQAESKLVEVLNQLQGELGEIPGSADTDALRQADRKRLLDRMAFLHSERIKRLDELSKLQSAPALVVSQLPVVKALGHDLPYSALAVDAFRDELDGVQERLATINSGLATRATEKQLLLEQSRRSGENVRLLSDRYAQAIEGNQRLAAKWELEQAELRRKVADAELALLAVDEEKLGLQRQVLIKQFDEMQQLLTRVLPAQYLSEVLLEEQRNRLAEVRETLTKDLNQARARHKEHEAERAALLKQAPLPDSKSGQRLELLEQILATDRAIEEGLSGLVMLAQLSSDLWDKRYLILRNAEGEERRQAVASIEKIFQGLVSRKRLFRGLRDAAAVEIRDQETRVANASPETKAHAHAVEVLALLQERAAIHERLELSASRLERRLNRWLGDLEKPGKQSLHAQAVVWGDQAVNLWRTFWQYELFAVEDVSEVDGRKISVSYGVTVGKSVGGIVLFIFGYWLFSRLASGLQHLLIRRFGITQQQAAAIRRWVMILFALGLILFILNLARIPLTVFAFMGGALAIGIGFGTQTIIKNFISGVIILFERKIRVGDIIELGGITGHVTGVDLRATTVRGFDGVEALVPNSSFLENQVINWTYSNQQIRRELRVGVAYGSDTRATEALLVCVALEHLQVLKQPAPEVYFEDFGDSALAMTLVFWIELGPGTVARRVDSELRHTLNRRLGELGIEIPFPQREVHIDVKYPIPVSLSGANL